MRTKLLLGAAALAASMACSMAQNVYSVNVVGYVNVTLTAGQFACLNNPLDATMGGTVAGGNNVANLFTGLNDGSYIQTWSPSLNDYDATYTWYSDPGAWDPTPPDLKPGQGFMVYLGQVDPPVPTVAVTFVGQVVQGAYTVQSSLPSTQFTMAGAPVPIGTNNLGGGLEYLGLVPAESDYVQTWSGNANDWNQTTTYYSEFSQWDPAIELVPAQGFFYYRQGDTVVWNSNFTVQ